MSKTSRWLLVENGWGGRGPRLQCRKRARSPMAVNLRRTRATGRLSATLLRLSISRHGSGAPQIQALHTLAT
eukprot:1865959-Amphidinium_carterae.1